MQQKFTDSLRKHFPKRNFSVNIHEHTELFVRDIKPYIGIEHASDSFQIRHRISTSLAHICVDGDFLKPGEAYTTPIEGKYPRPDTMLYTDNNLIFLELKMDVTSEKEENRWSKYKYALDQLEAFIVFLSTNYREKGDKISNYYGVNTHAIVSMSKYPDENQFIIPDSERATRLVKFKTNTKLEPKNITSIEL